MEIVKGSVVFCKAGKEKGLFFAVLEADGGFVNICNGRERPLEKAKKKNRRHIAPTLTVLPECSLKSNRELRRALSAFNAAADESID